MLPGCTPMRLLRLVLCSRTEATVLSFDAAMVVLAGVPGITRVEFVIDVVLGAGRVAKDVGVCTFSFGTASGPE
jgi:hypothetical protein